MQVLKKRGVLKMIEKKSKKIFILGLISFLLPIVVNFSLLLIFIGFGYGGDYVMLVYLLTLFFASLIVVPIILITSITGIVLMINIVKQPRQKNHYNIIGLILCILALLIAAIAFIAICIIGIWFISLLI